MSLLNDNLLTLKQAAEEGYGTVNSIKKQILRRVVEAEKVGNTWLVHRKQLELMNGRRHAWLSKRKNKTVG
jgi:hypothetical protein